MEVVCKRTFLSKNQLKIKVNKDLNKTLTCAQKSFNNNNYFTFNVANSKV